MTSPNRPPRSRRPSPPSLSLILRLLLLVSPLPPRASAFLFPLRDVAALLSLSHSLLARVATSRAARGDAAAATRAHRLSSHLSLLSSHDTLFLAWDYLRHYALYSSAGCGLSGAAAASRLLAAAAEASRLQTAADAAQWLRRNYAGLRSAAAQLLNGLLDSFSKQGPLREVVMDLKWEVEEGELLKEFLEVGAKDLEGLLVIAKDLLFSASASTSQHSKL